MERTVREGMTNFLEREEVTFDSQASPSFFPQQHTSCFACWEIPCSNHAAILLSPVCECTPAGYSNVLSILLTT